MLFTLHSSSQRSLSKYTINKERGNNVNDINDQQSQSSNSLYSRGSWLLIKQHLLLQKKNCRIVHCCQKEESFGTPKMGLFLCFYSIESGEKKNNGLIEIYRGRQGRVAMTTTIYSTMTCFEFLSVLFEYVIRVLLRSQIIRRAKLSVFHVCQKAHQHLKR